MRKLLAIVLSSVLLIGLASTVHAAGPTNYTYVYGFWADEIATPDAFAVAGMVYGFDYGIGNFNNPQDLHSCKLTNKLYIADTGNNRIVVFDLDESTDSFVLNRVVTGVYIDPADVPVLRDVGEVDLEEDDEEGAPHFDDGEHSVDETEHFDDDEDDVNPQTDEIDEQWTMDNGQLTIDDEDENEIDEDGLVEDEEFPLYNEDGLIFSGFNSPHGIFVDKHGEIFIADTLNQRILRLDNDFNYINSVFRPDDPTVVDDGIEFLPLKLVADFSGRIFTQVRNVNKGFMEFDVDGTFHGYMGASRVEPRLIDIFWKRIATDAQRRQMELFVPTEYNNLSLDHDGFVYATLSAYSGNPFDGVAPVRRLNAIGEDILIRNGYAEPAGDWWGGSFGGIQGMSRFADVTVFPNNSYAVLDRTRGRIFMYDYQGELLYVFGGIGNTRGRFLDVAAIDRMGDNLLVLDPRAATVTRFAPTRYGSYITAAMDYYYSGDYDKSAEMWNMVMNLNGNYDFAYIGMGRAALRNEQYAEAMRLYEIKHDQENYGKAFQLFRKDWIEANITTILLCLLVVYVILKTLSIVLKIRNKRKGE
ncbi:MAG: hypothetical protein FWH20_01225 [Oscillospiraceae bacterium]|nr:hypothetical protein [Oscillospiraceae bacterium]